MKRSGIQVQPINPAHKIDPSNQSTAPDSAIAPSGQLADRLARQGRQEPFEDIEIGLLPQQGLDSLIKTDQLFFAWHGLMYCSAL
jgi:hypothetical protein